MLLRDISPSKWVYMSYPKYNYITEPAGLDYPHQLKIASHKKDKLLTTLQKKLLHLPFRRAAKTKTDQISVSLQYFSLFSLMLVIP